MCIVGGSIYDKWLGCVYMNLMRYLKSLFQDSMWFIHYIANTEARYMQEKVGG